VCVSNNNHAVGVNSEQLRNLVSSPSDKLTVMVMARPLNKSQAAGRESRQRTLDAILDLMTSDAISSERMRESAMALIHFEGKLLEEIDRVSQSYDNRLERDVRTTLLLGNCLTRSRKARVELPLPTS
jgi:hypothetical protein